ncbi:MAG TPA: ATP-binding protein, partial [Solirubrobacteraceae bacterium]|nr:ATP-binding protein [Solirubrobacteraceae bacterium]
ANPVVPRVDGEPRLDLQAGAVIIGRRVSDRGFVDEVADNAGAAASVVSSGVVLESTLGGRARVDLATALGEGTRSRVVALDGEPTLMAAARVPARGDDAWLVLTRRTATLAGVQLSFTRTLFLATAAGLGVAALLAAWSVSRTTRPVRQLTTAAERVAAGERNVRTGIDQPDEVGRLAVAFDDMTASLATREEELVAAAATEAALRARLEVLTASIGEGLIAVTSDGRVQTVNPAAQTMLRAQSRRLVGRPVRDVLAGRDAAGGSLLAALGEPTHTDVRAVRGSVGEGQSAVAVAATAAPLRGADGDVLGRVYVLRDVSGEVEVERMKTEFLANISHELRTPLTPIKGYAEVLRRKEISFERTSEFAANISAATDRLERIIGMLVDFAALEAGRVDVNVEPTRLGGVVDATLAAWRAKVPDRKFTRRLAARLPEVAVDPGLLTRVLEELIDNAVKFSDGPITLRAQREGDRVRLTVHDTGSGIEAEQLEVIARDFHQADGSATRRHGGLGLGLSLVHRISERFDALVEIDSRPGAGTDASLLLRIADSGARR